jgi:hypothetical protein
MMTRERAIELLQEIAERESEYVASKDYASNMEFFASEENFMYASVYDKHNRYSSEWGTNMYYDDTYNVHTLTKKYGFDSVEDMMAYVFDRCALESEYNSTFCSNHPNTMVFTSVPVSETELYIDKCTHEELFDYLLTLTREEREDIFRETDLVYHESSLCGEITSFSPTLYHGGTIAFFTPLPNAIQILESREA